MKYLSTGLLTQAMLGYKSPGRSAKNATLKDKQLHEIPRQVSMNGLGQSI